MWHKNILYSILITMKKVLIKKLATLSIITFLWLTLAWCSSEKPMTEAEQAASYNMTLEEYQEVKEAAARMNMTIEEHMKMTEEEHMEMEWMDKMEDMNM